jgi:predicted ATP-binding protein involved in virulence
MEREAAMRIDQLTIHNFRKFEELTFDLHPQFNLLIGANGSGKTTLIEAIAKTFNVWSLGSGIGFSPWPINRDKDVRLTPVIRGDRKQFGKHLPVIISATGKIVETNGVKWKEIWDEIEIRRSHESKIRWHASAPFPVLAIYGISRAVLPANRRNISQKPQRWDAYHNWFDSKIDYDNLRDWFRRETTAAGADKGQYRPGYYAVWKAVSNCLPAANDLWFDVDQDDIVCSINGYAQPLGNLSDGQRMLLAMVADIAIKAVTLNAHLLPPDKLGPEDEPLPRVLKETPGVVLIDELDLHLHPSWQRRVVADLKRTFPSIQFVATTHSPQIIGEVPKEEIRIISDDAVYSPSHSFGVDSSRILEEIMGAKPRNESVDKLLAKLSRQISDEDFDSAHATLREAELQLGENDPEITSARALMAFIG